MVGGRPVRGGGRTGIVYDHDPVSKAFSRWQAEEFSEVERDFAREWRRSLSSLPLDDIRKSFAATEIGGDSSKTLAEAKAVADAAVADPAKSRQFIDLALLFLGASPEHRELVISRWSDAGSPPLATYAPYAFFVLTVEVFFQVALAASLISRARPSNRVDIAYLFYLPFCMVFVSADRLHARCAPHFIRANQDFIWGPDLKSDLSIMNEHFSHLPDETKGEGLYSFARVPPTEWDSLVARLWDGHLRPWRDRPDDPPRMGAEAQSRLIEELNQLTDAPRLTEKEVDFDLTEPEAVVLGRPVRKRKGSWWQVPKDLPDETPK
jgi:hypothetical protein